MEVNMAWNYRIVVKTTEDGNHCYGIHEVYYNEAGLADNCTETPCDPFGETRAELQDNVNQMAEAFTMPVLHYDDIFEAMDGVPEFMYTVANQDEDASSSIPVSDVAVREVINELYRSSYLDHYAKRKILEVMDQCKS
tara:strand:+ start:119 stop:532 length:414 start_codon:yes stop_codon:yes gene_type:complete